MEYLTITTALWDDPWVISLTSDERLLWLYLCTSPNNDNGFIEYAERLWRIRTGLEAEQIGHALSGFERAGKIARDSDMILVVKHLSHRRLRGNNLKGAAHSIIRRYAQKHPALVKLCFTSNGVDIEYDGVDLQNNGVAISDQIKSDQIKSDHVCDANEPPLLFDPEEQSILDALLVISERNQGDYDAQATLRYLRTNLSKNYPYPVILEAARKMDGWLLNPKNQHEVWSHARLRKFCDGVPLPAGSDDYVRPQLEIVE